MSDAPRFLTLYVNPAWRRSIEHSPLMFPWWGNAIGETKQFAKQLFDSFPFDTRRYGITDDIGKADMVLVPYRQAQLRRHDPALLAECAKAATDAGLPLLVDGVADGEPPLSLPNAYVLRIGGHRFLKGVEPPLALPAHMQEDPLSTRIEVPTEADDLLLRYTDGNLTLRDTGSRKPVVGFSGMVKVGLREALHYLKKDWQVYALGLFDPRYRAMQAGIFWRQQAVATLARSPDIECNFIIRDFYSGSSLTVKGDPNAVRREFVDNILGSDYALDVRGFANASVRLYEILSLGRIPVILDTERILPFSADVDWTSFALIVDHTKTQSLGRIIAEFHATLSLERFRKMQEDARRAYVERFRTDAQMPHVIAALERAGAFSAS